MSWGQVAGIFGVRPRGLDFILEAKRRPKRTSNRGCSMVLPLFRKKVRQKEDS